MKARNILDVISRGFRHFFDKNVPLSYKIVPVLAIVYLIYPFDLISDFVPFFGQADDITILSLAIAFFVDMADKRFEKKIVIYDAQKKS